MTEEKEIWKVWKDTRYNPMGALWEVSNEGNVKKNGLPYECRLKKNGYKVFGTVWPVHRAVAELFVPNPNSYNEVDHINTNSLDNRACNLQWCTHKQNMNNPITRKQLSEAHKDKPRPEGTRRKISTTLKENKNAKGKKYGPQSEEHKRKRSEAMKRYWQNKKLNISM